MDLSIIHQLTQEVINALNNKQPLVAQQKIDAATEYLNGLIDGTTEANELVELSKYEALIKLLKTKLK